MQQSGTKDSDCSGSIDFVSLQRFIYSGVQECVFQKRWIRSSPFQSKSHPSVFRVIWPGQFKRPVMYIHGIFLKQHALYLCLKFSLQSLCFRMGDQSLDKCWYTACQMLGPPSCKVTAHVFSCCFHSNLLSSASSSTLLHSQHNKKHQHLNFLDFPPLMIWAFIPVTCCSSSHSLQEEFALFYRKFFEAPGAAGFEARQSESGEGPWRDAYYIITLRRKKSDSTGDVQSLKRSEIIFLDHVENLRTLRSLAGFDRPRALGLGPWTHEPLPLRPS